MDNLEFLIELNANARSEAKKLQELISSYGFAGLNVRGEKEKPPVGEMAGAEFTNILTVVLISSAIYMSLKGLFDLIKTHIITSRNKEVRIKYKEYEIELKNFDDNELANFKKLLEK